MKKKAGIFIALCGLFAACGPIQTDHVRPRDPWVIRSVLDNQTRMLTLALHQDGYAAYNTESCTLYKIWRGGIHLDGAAYNNTKTVQPTSWGNTYWQDSLQTQVWSLSLAGAEKQRVRPQFRGYRIEDNHLTFEFEFLLPDGGKAVVYEHPEFLPEKNGLPAFTRQFRTEKVPAGVTIFLGNTALKSNGIVQIDLSLPSVPVPQVDNWKAADARGKYWLDKSGCNTCHEERERTIGPGLEQIAARYANTRENIGLLAQKVQAGGAGVWGAVPMSPHPHLAIDDLRDMVKYILSLQPDPDEPKPIKTTQSQSLPEIFFENLPKPGFGRPLEGVHPSFDLVSIRPAHFQPRVGGMDFMPDGSLLISTWDSVGAVYLLRGLETGDTSQVRIKRIAAGLAEPLGLKVVEGEIFVLQKQELTQLIDHDGDEVMDEYRTVCNAWGVTTDFHEFSYGLEYRDGFFYATLGLGMRLMAHETQHPDRGTTIKIARDGTFEVINRGLRQPNGIGFGPDGELFATENQGQWVPANKVIHLRPGDFYGCQFGTGDRFTGLEMTPPAVWLPQDEIGNSPSEPVLISTGPYAGQMLHGEVTHGGIKRVFLEKVNGAYQGCVFRFSQGMEAGINRLVWGPDGNLYAGGVGMNGNWTWQGHQFGLQRLDFNGKSTFEMFAVRATPEGLEIEFTEPLAAEQGLLATDYRVQQWRYESTPAYGGPKLDLADLPVSRVERTADRKKVRLTIPGCQERYVLHLRLPDDLTSASGNSLWSGDCWYTLNAIPGKVDF